MTDTKSEILSLLTRQEWSVQDLAHRLSITGAAVRQHIAGLEAQGLVTHRKQGGEPNRPTFLYRLSEQGKEAFPKRYDLLAHVLLQSLEEEVGTEGASRALERAGEQVAADLPSGRSADPAVRRRETLAALERELAWQGQWVEETNGELNLTLYLCPFQSVSKQHPEVCPAFFRGLFLELLQAGGVTCVPVTEGSEAGIACCRIRIDP